MNLCNSSFGYRLGFATRLTLVYSAVFITVFSVARTWIYRARFLSSLFTKLLPIRVEFQDISLDVKATTLRLQDLRLSLKEHGVQRSLFGTQSTSVDLFFANAVQVALMNRKRDVLGTWWRNIWDSERVEKKRRREKLELFVELENPRLYLEFDDIALMQSNWRKLSQVVSNFRSVLLQGMAQVPFGRKRFEQSAKQTKNKAMVSPVDWDIRSFTVRGTAVLQVRSKLMGGMKLVDDIYLSPTYFYQHRAMSLGRWIDQLEQIAMERMLSGDWTKAFEKMPQSFRNSLKTTAAQFLGTTEQVADVLLGDSKVADTVQNAIAQVARSRLEDLVTSFFYQRKLWQRSSYSREHAMDRYFTRKRKATRLPLSLNKSTSEKKSAGFFTGVSVLLAFFQRAHVAQVAFFYTKLKENGAKVYRLEDKESLARIKFEPLIVVTDNVSKVLNFIPDHCEKWEFVHKSWLEKCLSKQQVLSTKSYQLAAKDNNDHKNVAGHASASQKAIDSGRDSEDSEDDASKTTLTRLSVDEYQQRKDFASKIPVYCCQRKTLDKPCANEKLYQLFLLLEQRRLLENAMHALAYHRAAAVLRVYPYELLSVEEASWLPCFGAKCLKAVKEYLKTGNIQECVEFEQSERFQCLRLFCGIHGVGPTTACLWYDQYHLRTLQDVKSFLERKRLEGHPLAIKEYGLQYYDDLQQKISRKEALDIYHHVESAFREVDPHLSCCLVGGFRRGQEYGHDVDILGCHRVEEYGHVGKLAAILQILGKRFRYLSLEHESSSNRRYDELQVVKGGEEDDDASSEPTSLDGPDSSERFIGLIFYPGEEKRSIARRLDIVLTRKSEWTFSLISWTGSSFFERDLRRYCAKERKLRFNSHGIFEKHSKQPVQRCNSLTEEQQVFEYLQLPWLAPEERCA